MTTKKTDFVIMVGGEERMTIAAANLNAAKRQARRYLARCVSSSPRLFATVCQTCGSDGQWIEELATVSAKPTVPGLSCS